MERIERRKGGTPKASARANGAPARWARWGAAAVAIVTTLAACSWSASGEQGDADAGRVPVAHPRDAAPPVDEAGDDASTDDAGLACATGQPVAPPVWRPPHAPREDCTGAEIASYYVACLTSYGAACASFQAAHPACARCLGSKWNDPERGAVVVYDHPYVAQLNFDGCTTLLEGDPIHAGCGSAVQSVVDCTIEACSACSVRSGDDERAFARCQNATSATTCGAELAAQEEACRDNAIWSTRCAPSPGESYRAAFERLGAMFCGRSDDAPGDAGGPPGITEAGSPDGGDAAIRAADAAVRRPADAAIGSADAAVR